MTGILANELKVGDRAIDAAGNAVTVIKIRTGDQTDFGRIAKFWHPKPLTIWFKTKAGETLHSVVGEDERIETAAASVEG